MWRGSRPQTPHDQDNLSSALTTAIEGFNLAKEVMNVAPAKAAFGSVSIILAMIRDSRLNEEDYVKLGIACADVCISLSRGMKGRNLVDLNQSVSEAIGQLTTTVAGIQRAILGKRRRWKISKLFHAKIDTQTINTWRSDLGRILELFNVELALNIHNAVTDIANDVREIRDAAREAANERLNPAQAPEPGEFPPPPPRACIGRDLLIEDLVCRTEELAPSALIGTGGIGKTAIALAVLHHERVVRKFLDQRRFLRCDEFPTSIVNFLDRLSTVIGAGIKNVTSLAPLRPFITAQPMVLVLDNAETVLDPHAQDAQAIYLVIEELSRLSNLCLIITSRLSAIPSECKRIKIPPLPRGAAREIFYRIYPEGEQSDIIDSLLRRLDFHPLSITILATIASQKSWDYNRILKEWEKQRVKVLQTGNKNLSLAATIELSLDSPTFLELGPQAREVLGVVAFFPQGIDEEKLDWLFPDIPDRENVIDVFCMLSLTSRYKRFVTMLAPLREYLHPEDFGPPSLLWAVKGRYFSKLRLVEDGPQPGVSESGGTKWIIRESSNMEHLLEAFVALGGGSEDVQEAYVDFLLHLSCHKPARVVAEMEGGSSFNTPKKHDRSPGSFWKQMLSSDGSLGQKVINQFDKVLLNGTITGDELARCLQVLCQMCSHRKTVPDSMHIEECLIELGNKECEGGFSTVFRSKYQGQPVAVKILELYTGYNIEKTLHMFSRETIVWRHLQHPNILPFIGVILKPGRFAMVSQWMDHGNINEYIKAHEGVNRTQLLVDAANGLDYMHSIHMVHGDLKGVNVLINNGFHACLADFGLSTGVHIPHHTASNASLVSVSSESSKGSLMSFTGGGTVHWMSPELLNPEQFGITSGRPTKQSDCYALGMLVYEVLCGVIPYSSFKASVMVMFSILEGVRPQKPDVAESLGFTNELWGMVEHCWLEGPDERPEVGEILHCLERAAQAWDTRPLPVH